jgi:hypothetical protein
VARLAQLGAPQIQLPFLPEGASSAAALVKLTAALTSR